MRPIEVLTPCPPLPSGEGGRGVGSCVLAAIALAAAALSPLAAQQPAVTPADSLRLTLKAPAEVRAGERASFVIGLENRSRAPLDLYLRGRTLTVDVEVTDSSGRMVWRRLEGEIIPAIVHLRTLAPGEQIEVEAAWRPGAPGLYQVRGLLLTEGTPRATEPAPLRVVPR